MERRLRILGGIIAVIGVIAVAGGAYGYTQVQAGADALQGFSKAQNVTLSYNDQGQLLERGNTEGAQEILALLKDTWKWPVNQADLNPNDPVVNTGTEYMYQMATIATHTLNGTTQVTLAEPVAYDGNGDGTVDADRADLHARHAAAGCGLPGHPQARCELRGRHLHGPHPRPLLDGIHAHPPARRQGP